MIPNTPASLLQNLHQPVDQATWHSSWEEFVKLYVPILYQWLTKAGVDLATKDLVVQEVLITLIEKMKTFQYDPKKKFRHWLQTVAMNKYRQHVRDRRPQSPLQSEINDPKQPDPAEVFWEKELQSEVIARAFQIIKETEADPSSWEGFAMYHLQEKTLDEIAAIQGKSPEAVSAANYRIMKKLRTKLAGMLD